MAERTSIVLDIAIPTMALLTFGIVTNHLWNAYSQYYQSLPPGPPAHPILGHLRMLPATGVEEKFYEWSRTYGDVIRVRVLHKTYIVINSHEAAIALLHKKGSKFASRPTWQVFKFIGWGDLAVMLPYNKDMVHQRKMLNGHLYRGKVKNYLPEQMETARGALASWLDQKTSDEASKIVFDYVSSVLFSVAYGQENDGSEKYKRLIQIMKRGLHGVVQFPFGDTVWDFLPYANRVPKAFWKWYYDEEYTSAQDFFDEPYFAVQAQMEKGEEKSSFMESHIRRLKESEVSSAEQEAGIFNIKRAAANFVGAGLETTQSILKCLIIYMALHPEFCKKAQNEIDRVVGRERLPDIDDRPNLPYLDAIIYETLRLISVFPSGVPHVSTEDAFYKGMFIPKGSYVIANVREWLSMKRYIMSRITSIQTAFFQNLRVWGSLPRRLSLDTVDDLHDEYFELNEKTPHNRICPGRYYASNAIWAFASSMIAVFNFHGALDENGKEIVPSVALNDRLAREPLRVDVRVEVRSAEAKRLIESAAAGRKAVETL